MKYLIFGNKGQLGKEFTRLLVNRGEDVLGFDSDEADITNFFKVYEKCREFRPDFILNCAAYNQVDLAEKDYHQAYDINAHGVKNIGLAADHLKIKTVHFSTDYVFDGEKGSLYIETDNPNPLNEYGKSKLAGEKLLSGINDYNLIFRLSWVYGAGEQNFIHKLMNWSKKNKVLKIVEDELSVPTFTKTIAEISLKALDNELSGLFHLTSTGYASRYDWAKEIAKLLDLENSIEKAKISDFDLPAIRPAKSAMDNKKLIQALGIDIPDWRDDLRDYIKRIS